VKGTRSKLIVHISYILILPPLCGDYNLTKISLKQKDENMQEVSRPTAHLQQNHANGVVYVS